MTHDEAIDLIRWHKDGGKIERKHLLHLGAQWHPAFTTGIYLHPNFEYRKAQESSNMKDAYNLLGRQYIELTAELERARNQIATLQADTDELKLRIDTEYIKIDLHDALIVAIKATLQAEITTLACLNKNLDKTAKYYKTENDKLKGLLKEWLEKEKHRGK